MKQNFGDLDDKVRMDNTDTHHDDARRPDPGDYNRGTNLSFSHVQTQ